MKFLWPQFLWLLAALPLLVLLYVWLLRRKKKLALRYASLSIVQRSDGRRPDRAPAHPARAVPAGAGRDAARRRPADGGGDAALNQQTIILAMDVSGSMRAADVLPNRLVAAQNAAKSFIAELPRHVKVGIVAFAGSRAGGAAADVNREDLVTAIDRSSCSAPRPPATPSSISLATLFPDAGIDTRSRCNRPGAQRGFAIDRAARRRTRNSRRWRRAPTPRQRSSC